MTPKPRPNAWNWSTRPGFSRGWDAPRPKSPGGSMTTAGSQSPPDDDPSKDTGVVRFDKLPFTPTELRILKLLADGLPHTRKELHACLNDTLGPLSNIKQHVSNLRRKLRLVGQDVVCGLAGYKIYYQQVRLLPRRAE